jgi:hypothetical protein
LLAKQQAADNHEDEAAKEDQLTSIFALFHIKHIEARDKVKLEKRIYA